MAAVQPLPEPTGQPEIGILEKNRTVLARATRIVRAASGLAGVATDEDPGGLRLQLSPATRLLLCDGADLELALEWQAHRFPHARIITWSTGPVEPLIELAAAAPAVVSVLGWPGFQSMPRPWEIGLAVRQALHVETATLPIAALFAGSPTGVKYKPRSSDDRDATVAELTALAERAGAVSRVASRIGEIAHELLMNAMYDAPVNHYGEARYAHDRRASIVLDEHEVPTARMATDGNLIAVQVADPFGRLTRAHVMDGILRGQRAREASHDDAVIDDSHGGAGLGLWKIYTGAAVTLVDLTPAHTTCVTAVFDIDVGPREARTMPPSLHVFERSSLDVG